MRNTFIAVCLGILAGVVLLLGINTVVTAAVAPVLFNVQSLKDSQSRMEQNLSRRIDMLEQRILTVNSNQRLPAAPGGCGGGPSTNTPPEEDLNKVYMLNVGATPVLGKQNAPVMITMFADLQCPFCARFAEPMKEVLKAYPGKVRLMIKNFPLSFHPNAMPAAKFALAANLQNKYFEAVDLLLKNGADVSDAKIKEYIQTLGLDENKLREDLKNKDSEFEKQIKDDMSLGAQSDVRGTPTFFLNGKKTNARDLASWKAEIDKIIK